MQLFREQNSLSGLRGGVQSPPTAALFPKPDAAPNLEPRDEIRRTELAPVIRLPEGGVQLLQLPWGLSPAARRAARSSTCARKAGLHARALPGAGLALFRVHRGQEPEDALALYESRRGLVLLRRSHRTRRRAGRQSVEAFTLLTTGPGPDVAPYHNRQRVILERAEWAAWLTSSEPPRDLLVPSPPGSLEVRECPREGERMDAEPDLP